MTLPEWPHQLLFMVLTMVLCIYVLTVSGHFPARHRDTKFSTLYGRTALWGSLLAACVAFALTLSFAISELPWYAAIIGGGLMVLAAPLVIQPSTDGLINSRFALIALALVLLALSSVTLLVV